MSRGGSNSGRGFPMGDGKDDLREREAALTKAFSVLDAGDERRHLRNTAGNEALVLNPSPALADVITKTAAEVPEGTEQVIDSVAAKLTKQNDGWDEFPAPNGLDLHG